MEMDKMQVVWKNQKELRCGYTTGSCAAAAAKAAAAMLFSGEEVRQVSLMTPKGIELYLEVEEIQRENEAVSCAIQKDSGDDPDVTNGIFVYAKVTKKKEKGMTLWDAMVAMYEKYGYYKDTVKSIGLKGIEGLAKIQEIMENFRKNPPKALGGYEVTSVRDYKKNTITDVATGEVKETGLPESNVLYYDMNDGAWLCIRPSGTEPKIKFYYGVKGTSLDDAEVKSKAVGDELMGMVDKMM